MFLFLVLRYPIRSLRTNLLPYPCFPFLSSKYWFPLPHWWYRRANGHGPLVCCLCVLAMATDKAAVYDSLLLGSRQGVLTAYSDEGKKKKGLIQNNPVLFFFTLHAKLKTVAFLKQKGFANMFRIRVRECIHRSVKGPWGQPVFTHELGLGFWGTWIPEGFGSLFVNYTCIFSAIMTTFIG